MSAKHPLPPQKDVSRRNVLKTTAAATVALGALGTNFAHAAGSSQIRVGLVGCGGRGRGAAGNVVEAGKLLNGGKGGSVVVTACADLFPEVIEETKGMFNPKPKDEFDIPDNRYFCGLDSYKKVLALDDINYVILATPPGFRPMMVEAAIAAGKNAFIEKPAGVDPVGARSVMETAKKAAEKNLGILAGTQRRHMPGYIETIKRIHDGAIGKITAGQVYWMQGETRMVPRQPQWADTEYQLRNWWYFTWLSGDFIVEQHMHQIDIANWVIGSHPKFAIATGGRQVRTDPAYGHIYDHFSTDLEYPDGQRVLSVCRQIDGCYSRIQEHFIGTAGEAMADNKITGPDGKAIFKFKLPKDAESNPYVLEHRDFIESIQAGKPLNEGQQVAESTLSAIMARLSAYSGQMVTWNDMMKSTLSLWPADIKLDAAMPTPPVALPGKYKFT